MLKFKQVTNKQGEIQYIKTRLKGQELLNTPKLNKGCAFSREEREKLGLLGKLPYHVETLDQQAARLYEQYLHKNTLLERNVYLRNIHSTNETLFYRLVSDHLKEMLPIIYTPTVGEAVMQFSHEFQRSRGLYLAYPDRHQVKQMLRNRLNPEIDLIVMTDGGGVLGIGDQGVGGMEISIAKLMVYTLCGGINPHRVLPIHIDVGTNNEKLLNDPMYLGWRHPRLTGQDYDDFMGMIVEAIREEFPWIFLHWEDFGRDHARKNLERFRDQLCTFNGDMQGTGAVALGTVLAAVAAKGEQLIDQRIVFFGAGTAGMGIAEQLCLAMVRQGLTLSEARSRFWLVDRPGLLTSDMPDLPEFQRVYARPAHEAAKTLKEVVSHMHPTVLIGCSAVAGAFTQDIVQDMAKHVERPIIFPLSNPTTKVEATPADLLAWTQGKAIIATGSPFGEVEVNGTPVRISQCNNALVFPGIGKGIIASRATRLSDEMLWVAAQTLAACSPKSGQSVVSLLPDLADVREVSIQIALAVAKQARLEGLSPLDEGIDLEQVIRRSFWYPRYYPYR